MPPTQRMRVLRLAWFRMVETFRIAWIPMLASRQDGFASWAGLDACDRRLGGLGFVPEERDGERWMVYGTGGGWNAEVKLQKLRIWTEVYCSYTLTLPYPFLIASHHIVQSRRNTISFVRFSRSK